MTKPTPDARAYDWHRKALLAAATGTKPPPIHENEPMPGWYMRRLVKDGPMVRARIWLEGETDDDGELVGEEKTLCEIDGRRVDAYQQWTWLAKRPITEDQYMDMIARGFASGPEPAPVPLPQQVATMASAGESTETRNQVAGPQQATTIPTPKREGPMF